jgi:hypothetical protein
MCAPWRDQACLRQWHLAVDAHGRAGREGRRGEEQHRVGNIFRLTDMARRQALRRAREQRLALVIGHLVRVSAPPIERLKAENDELPPASALSKAADDNITDLCASFEAYKEAHP